MQEGDRPTRDDLWAMDIRNAFTLARQLRLRVETGPECRKVARDQFGSTVSFEPNIKPATPNELIEFIELAMAMASERDDIKLYVTPKLELRARCIPVDSQDDKQLGL
jgi:hypothetical protein